MNREIYRIIIDDIHTTQKLIRIDLGEKAFFPEPNYSLISIGECKIRVEFDFTKDKRLFGINENIYASYYRVAETGDERFYVTKYSKFNDLMSATSEDDVISGFESSNIDSQLYATHLLEYPLANHSDIIEQYDCNKEFPNTKFGKCYWVLKTVFDQMRIEHCDNISWPDINNRNSQEILFEVENENGEVINVIREAFLCGGNEYFSEVQHIVEIVDNPPYPELRWKHISSRVKINGMESEEYNSLDNAKQSKWYPLIQMLELRLCHEEVMEIRRLYPKSFFGDAMKEENSNDNK